MRILIDECVPHDIRHHLPGHDAFTVRYMGWGGKKNGELLSLMVQDGFDALLTLDQNLQYHQNLSAAGIAVVLLSAETAELTELLPLMPAVRAALCSIQAGQIIEISVP